MPELSIKIFGSLHVHRTDNILNAPAAALRAFLPVPVMQTDRQIRVAGVVVGGDGGGGGGVGDRVGADGLPP